MRNRILTLGILFLLVFSTVIPMSLGENVKISDTTEQPSTLSRGKTLYVGGTGEGNYTKIQDAINDAVDGDTVFVYDDSSPYYENVVVNKSINLVGEDKNSTIIDGEGDLIVVSLAEMAFVESVAISGFTIQNGRTGIDYDTGINNINRHSLLLNCEHTASAGFYNNVLINNEIGIRVGWLSTNVFLERNKITLNERGIILDTNSFDNLIYENTILDNDCGICLYDSYANHIHDNIISSNNNVGIYLRYSSSSNTITDNNIIDNDNGIWLDDSSSNTIMGNIISNNDISIGFSGSNNNTITGNNILDNDYGICLRGSSGNTITDNTISSNDEDGIIITPDFLLDITVYSRGNTILKNNFIDNVKDATFYTSFLTRWKQNYWDRPRILPKLIFGLIKIDSIWIPWINIDWHPAQEPYDIS